MWIAALILGLAVGASAAWLVAAARGAAEAAALRATLEHERNAASEKLALVERTRDDLNTQFKLATSEAVKELRVQSREDVEQRSKAVEQLVKPIRESLERVDGEVKILERSRRQDYGALTEHLRRLSETTGSLATALRSPSVRGQWGEMQLRNAVELAGMLRHCDFEEQTSVTAEDGRLRPDMIVNLPGGRRIVVDAKVPLLALLDAENAPDEEARERLLDDYVRHVREHVSKLSAKAYWQQFSPSPDFVVMFLPGESFYRAALQRDPHLLKLSLDQRVHIADPTTLITLLRTVSVGWREEQLAENARAIEKLGRELYERLATMTEHFGTLGKRLDGAVAAYNQAVGSLERRVLVSARRFTERGIGSEKELAAPAALERAAQPPQTVELPAGSEIVELPAASGPAAADAA